jgi:hypothetical protein
VYADIEAAKEKKESGGGEEDTPAEPGDEDEEGLPDEDSHDPDDL